MSVKLQAASPEVATKSRNAASGALLFIVRLPFMIAHALVKAFAYIAWHLAFSLLCMLRPVVNMMILGGVVMLPLAVAAFVKPEAANGMPFWGILLMAVGSIGFAMGYSRFVDWIRPPDAEDPAERFRRREGR